MQALNGFSLAALHTRLNAHWFSGRANDAQLKCLSGFAVVWLIRNRVFDAGMPVTWPAYVLATTLHETAATMLPIEEYGRGKGRPYGEPDPLTGQTYYGRGYVQLTWKENYAKAQDVVINVDTLDTDVPLVMQPDLAMRPGYAAQIALNGMEKGWFTGKKLSDYLTDTRTDYVNARRIINGADKAELIAGYANEAELALRLARGESIIRVTVRNGTQGDDVREMQLMLGVSADGMAGNQTIAALVEFQQRHCLDADGICGKNTWAAMDRQVRGF
jgi:hypothetical protein